MFLIALSVWLLLARTLHVGRESCIAIGQLVWLFHPPHYLAGHGKGVKTCCNNCCRLKGKCSANPGRQCLELSGTKRVAFAGKGWELGCDRRAGADLYE